MNQDDTLIARHAALTCLVAPKAGAGAVGISVTDLLGEYDRTPTVYVRTLNGRAVKLLSRSQAKELYDSLLAAGKVTVRGRFDYGLNEGDSGFGWTQPGFRLAHRHVVRPVRVSGISLPQPLRLGLELHWSPDQDGHTALSFTGLFPNEATAELVLSCLWGGLKGRYAARALIAYPDGRRRDIASVTRACDLIDRALMDVVIRTGAHQRVSALPPPESGQMTATPAPDVPTT